MGSDIGNCMSATAGQFSIKTPLLNVPGSFEMGLRLVAESQRKMEIWSDDWPPTGIDERP